MKIAALSDTHSYHDRVKVPKCDVFICAGDFTQIGTVQQIASFNAWLKNVPAKHKLICAGNHDFYFERVPDIARSLITNGIYLQDESYIIEGFKFYASPWSPRFYDWAFNVDRGDKIAEKWAKIPDDTDVLITHGPPYGLLDSTSGLKTYNTNIGCQDLLERIQNLPSLKYHIFGHAHYPGGTRCTVSIKDRNVEFINAAFVADKPQVMLFTLKQRRKK